jgi:hypothetical protein
VERGDWYGSEIGKQHKFLSSVQSAGQARTMSGKGGGGVLL